MSSFRPRTFAEYLQIIWRRRLLFLLVTGLVLVSTFIVIGRIADQYQSSASVVVAGKEEDRQAIASRVATITERINSRAFLEPLIERHDLYPGEVSAGRMDAAVGRLRRDIKIDTKYRGDNPETVMVAYRNSNPAVAKDVATDLVSTFGRMNQAVEREADDRGKQINDELAEIENRLNQLGQQRAIAGVRSRGTRNTSASASASRAERIAAESSIETLSDKQYALEQQIGEQKRQIGEQEKIAKTSPGDARSGSSYGVLLVRKAELEGQLKDFASQYTEKNPKVIQAQTQVAEINRQIAQMNAAAGQDGVPLNSPEARELRSMQRELSRMQTDAEVTRRELERKKQALEKTPQLPAPSGYVPASASDAPIVNIAAETDKDRLRDRYNSLLRQQDDLRQARGRAAGLDPGVFQIVDLPVEPSQPSGPDRLKLRLLGLGLALLAGLVVLAIIEAPRLFAIRDDRDVRYYLGAPVVALIPETLTPHERGRYRRLMLARMLGVLLLGAVAVPALVLVLDRLRVFQLLASRW